MKFNPKIILVIILFFLLGMTGGLKFLSQRQNLKQIKINNQAIFVEIAKTPQEMEKGLSGRNSLNQSRGMLFVFDKAGNYTFWMKDMKFNLDFMFINGGMVVDLAENVPFPKEGEQPQVIQAKELFDKVLEINQGQIKKLNLKVGDRIGQIGQI